jgi:hypothetical protein
MLRQEIDAMTSALAAGLYLAAAAAIGLAAAFVRRPIPRGVLASLTLLPLLYFLPDVLAHRTRIPTEQTYLTSGARTAPRNPWLNDVATEFVPWAEKVRVTWRAGEMPFRDRWSGCGSALAANGQTAAFSPLTWPTLVLPLSDGLAVAAAIRVLLALAGMWLWLRELQASPPAAAFGAVSFAISFAIVPWLFFPHAGTMALWPWVFFGVERLRDPECPGRSFAFLTAVLAVWTLLGHVESMVLGGALLALVLGARWVSGDLPDARRVIPRAALAALAAAGLTAFFLVPHALAIFASHRREMVRVPVDSAFFSWAPHGFVWAGWRTTLFPGAFGDLIGAPMIPGGRGAYPEMAMGYFGIAGWALALLVLRPGPPRARITAALVTAILVSLGVGLGAWPFAEIFGHLPVLSWLVPVRILPWTALAGSTLAALELTRWLADAPRGPRKAALVAVGAAAVLALLAFDTQRRYASALAATAGQRPSGSPMELSLWTLGAFALSAMWIGSRSPAVRRVVPLLFVLVTTVELTLQALRQYRAGPAAAVFAPTPLSEFLRSRPKPFRIVGEGWEFFPQRHAMIGVEDIRTHDPIERYDYMEFLDLTCGYTPADYFKHIQRIDAPALDFLNVGYMVSFPGRAPSGKWRSVYSGQDGSVFENRDVLPRVFAPRRVVGVPGVPPRGWVQSATRLFGGALPQIAGLKDFRERAFVLGEPPQERENGTAEITDYSESANRASFRVRVDEPALLVASLVQDGGWSARDERGAQLPVTLANGPFLAVSVPAGQRRVLFDYTPPGWQPGLALSLATAVVLGAVFLRRIHFSAAC